MKTSELTIELNARLQPSDRNHHYGIPLKKHLEEIDFGSIVAAGTFRSSNGETESCDIAIETQKNTIQCRDKLIEFLNEIGIPKGSKIIWNYGRNEIEVGSKEGLALYMKPTDLSREILQKYNFNELMIEIGKLIEGIGRILSYWTSLQEIAFYLYGNSFEEMKMKITSFLN